MADCSICKYRAVARALTNQLILQNVLQQLSPHYRRVTRGHGVFFNMREPVCSVRGVLARCMRVCRLWADEAVALLWSGRHWYPGAGQQSLFRVASPSRRIYYADHIRSLNVPFNGTDNDILLGTDFPRLSDISLRWYEDAGVQPCEVAQLIRHGNLKTLEARFHTDSNRSENPDWDSLAVTTFFGRVFSVIKVSELRN